MAHKSISGFFKKFFPLEHAVQGLGQSQAEYDSKYSDIKVTFDQAHLVRFIGVLIKMKLVSLSNREYYWRQSEWDGVDAGVSQFMSKNVFKRTLECFKLPKD